MAALTLEAIERVLGPKDMTLAAEIIATGATEEELVEAHAWVVSDEGLVNDMRPFPAGRIALLIDILRPIEGVQEEED